MDDSLRLKLNQMINENNVSDQTELIRELKHSSIIKKEVLQILKIMDEYKNATYEELRDITMNECYFLFSCYTDIYTRILKKELSIDILFKFLNVLERIENGELDQHNGSFLVGTLLKELYVDSALKKSEILDKQNEPTKPIKVPVNISWKQYKSEKNISYAI
jgi:hypothetical protein